MRKDREKGITHRGGRGQWKINLQPFFYPNDLQLPKQDTVLQFNVLSMYVRYIAVLIVIVVQARKKTYTIELIS